MERVTGNEKGVEVFFENVRNAEGRVENLTYKVLDNGIVNIHFYTPMNKYLEIGGGWTDPTRGAEYVIGLSDLEPTYLSDGMVSWFGEILVKPIMVDEKGWLDWDNNYQIVILPLKGEYNISLIPLSIILDL